MGTIDLHWKRLESVDKRKALSVGWDVSDLQSLDPSFF